MKVSAGDRIEKLIDADKWDQARDEIMDALKERSSDHWLLTRLALTYYEQKNYTRALEVSKVAVRVAPNCPLVLWDYAGSLDMCHHKREAISIWKKLLKRGVDSVAFDECGEGRRWARSLLNDCRYRIGRSFHDIGDHINANKYYKDHLEHRCPGIPSIYDIRFVRKKLIEVRNETGDVSGKTER